jgi:endo-1,4-beta-xylanase
MSLILKTIGFLIAVSLVISCQNTSDETTDSTLSTKEASLKNAYQGDFMIGTTLGRQHINQTIPKAAELIPREFNSITAENIMKWMHIHPKKDSFAFEMADKFVELGQQQNMFLVGHTLVWHSQLAPYVNNITDEESLESHLKDHIHTIVGRYKGKIHGWDVVNEALNEDGTLRESIFLKVLGENYIQKAFEWAAEADPNAELYYNDYNIEQPAKRKGCIEMIKKLQVNGVKIDGVGIQGHWSLKGASIKDIEDSIKDYSALGLKVHFTELDVTVLPNPWDLKGAEISQNYEGSPFMNPYPEGLPDSVQVQLAQRYQDLFKLFTEYSDQIERVTFWGVQDGHSWLNNWPIKGRTNYPLLFDRNFDQKEAYHSVLGLKQKADP